MAAAIRNSVKKFKLTPSKNNVIFGSDAATTLKPSTSKRGMSKSPKTKTAKSKREVSNQPCTSKHQKDAMDKKKEKNVLNSTLEIDVINTSQEAISIETITIDTESTSDTENENHSDSGIDADDAHFDLRAKQLDQFKTDVLLAELTSRKRLKFCDCGMGFEDRRMYDVHRAMHSHGEEKLKCSKCGLSCSDFLQLQTHWQQVSHP